MTPPDLRIIVTGAGGYIGAALVRALLREPSFSQAKLTICDVDLSTAPADPRVRQVQGDLCEPETLKMLLGKGADLVFHLASVLGGAAEADYPLARRVNVEATLSLFEALRELPNRPRVVFASSIAVYGPTPRDEINDETPTDPTMIYGAQKLIAEIALQQFTARGWIDGIALRLPGIVARPGADARLKSAFLNRVFFAIANGDDFVMPVSADGFSWLISMTACTDALVHAAGLSADRLGKRRAFNLPAQRVRLGDLIAVIQAVYPASGSRVSYEPDETLQAQFAAQPPLTTRIADELGFHHDGDVAMLVKRAYPEPSKR